MEFDLYFLRKKTAIGKFMVQRLNRLFAAKIAKLFQGQGSCKLLEIGPGVGAFAEVLHKVLNGKLAYYGIEANTSLYEQGLKKGYTLWNASIPPFPDNEEWKKFDCIYLSHVVEHFPDFPTVTKAFAGMREILQKNGYLVIFVPDYLDWKEDFYSGDYSHSYVTTERRMRELVNDMGFAIREIRTYRSCFSFPTSALLYPFHCIVKIIAGVVYHYFCPIDALFKMKITFARNLFLICQKKSEKSM